MRFPQGAIELGYSEITAASTVTGITLGDGTTPLILSNVIVGQRPIKVIFECGEITTGATADWVEIALFYAPHGGTYVHVAELEGYVYNQFGHGGHREKRLSLTPGAYDFKIQIASGTAGHTATVQADSGAAAGNMGPAFLQVVEL